MSRLVRAVLSWSALFASILPYLRNQNHPLFEWSGLNLMLWHIYLSEWENGEFHVRYIRLKGLNSISCLWAAGWKRDLTTFAINAAPGSRLHVSSLIATSKTIIIFYPHYVGVPMFNGHFRQRGPYKVRTYVCNGDVQTVVTIHNCVPQLTWHKQRNNLDKIAKLV